MLRPLASLLLLATPGVAAVDYLQQIKPLLQSQSVKCHGATSQKGKLKLDTAAAALKRWREHGTSVVPGSSAESLLVQTLEGTHAEISKMPYKRPAARLGPSRC